MAGLVRAVPRDSPLPPTPPLALTGVKVMAKNTAAASDTRVIGWLPREGWEEAEAEMVCVPVPVAVMVG